MSPPVFAFRCPMPSPDLLVLCYHALSESWRSELAITPRQLDLEVGRILSRGYRGATFTDAVRSPRTTRTLVVSFDDAYRSTRLATPILARHGVPGTVFAPTSFVGREDPMRWPGIEQWADGEHREELRCMDWEELRTLTAAGWEIGSHTVTHPVMPELGTEELERELHDSRAAIERHLDRPCTAIAYPYGRWDQRIADAAAAAGYLAGATLGRWPHRAQPLAWPRVGCYAGGRLFGFKTSAGLRRLTSRLPIAAKG